MFYSTITNQTYQSLEDVIRGHNQIIGFTENRSLITEAVLEELGIYLIKIQNPNVAFDEVNQKKVLSEIIESSELNKEGKQIKVFTSSWKVINKTQEEKDLESQQKTSLTNLKINENRLIRDGELKSCDWTQLPDVNLTSEQKAAWAAYRQQLRDITTQPNFPFAVRWPTKPN